MCKKSYFYSAGVDLSKKRATGIILLLLVCLSPLLAAPCGDVNSSNGVINIVDALMTAQFSVGLNPVGFDQGAADVNGDGRITIVDALQIAQYSVGLISQFKGCSAGSTDPEPDEIIGFGRNTTGGKGGREVIVTNADELLAATALAEPLIITIKGSIVHNVSGGDDNSRIFVRTNNKTIQGADSNASVDANFNVVTASNIIFRNLNLSNPEGKGTGDAIEFAKSCTNIWVNHVTFGQCKDGALDIKKACDYITISWCKFVYTSATADHNFANLIGHSDNVPEDRGKLKVTMHHNWYVKNVIERMPRVRYGQVHIFNNYYSSERTNYVIGVGMEAQILLEASYFENQGDKTWYDWGGGGKIQWTNDNVFDNTTISTWAPNSNVFDPPYEYLHVKQTAAEAKASVMQRAGVLR